MIWGNVFNQLKKKNKKQVCFSHFRFNGMKFCLFHLVMGESKRQHLNISEL